MRFRNMRLSFLWVLIGIGGSISFLAGDANHGFAFGATFFCYSTYAAVMHYLGVFVDDVAIWIPLPLITNFPVIVIGRKRIPINDIYYIKSLGRRNGYETIAIKTVASLQGVSFQTREPRLAFLKFIKSARPDLPIYRSR